MMWCEMGKSPLYPTLFYNYIIQTIECQDLLRKKREFPVTFIKKVLTKSNSCDIITNYIVPFLIERGYFIFEAYCYGLEYEMSHHCKMLQSTNIPLTKLPSQSREKRVATRERDERTQITAQKRKSP